MPESEPLAGVLGKRINELRGVYQNAQETLQQRLTQAALTDFQKFRYGELVKQIDTTVSALNTAATQIAAQTVPSAYGHGADLAMQAIKAAGVDVGKLNLGNKLHSTAIQAVSDQMTLDLMAANQTIGTNAKRILRATQQSLIEERQINQVIAEGLLEGGTRKEVSRTLEARLRDQLTNGQFVTINGRNYRPDHYADLVVRTRTREAVTHGTIGAAAEQGVDLFQISVHEHPCTEICQALQGKVFSVSGQDPAFPRLEQRPPLHPNCEHVLLPFIKEAFDDTDIEALKELSNSQLSVAGNDDYQTLVRKAQAKQSIVKGLENTIHTLTSSTPAVGDAGKFTAHANALKAVEQSVYEAKISGAKAQQLLAKIADEKAHLKLKAQLTPSAELMKAAKEAKIKNWDYAVKNQLVDLLTNADDAANVEIHAALAAKKEAALAASKAKAAAKKVAADKAQEFLEGAKAFGDGINEVTQKILSGADNYKLSQLGGNLAAWKENTLASLANYTSKVGQYPEFSNTLGDLAVKIAKNVDDVYKFIDDAPKSEIAAALKKAGFKYWSQVSKEEASILLKTTNQEVWAELETSIKEKMSAKIKAGVAAKKAAKPAEAAAQQAAVAAAKEVAEEAAEQVAAGLAPVVDVRTWEAVDQAWDTARPQFTSVPGRANVSGVHRKYFYTDEAGNKWLFKPYPEEFRADADEMAYRVQRLLDPDCVEVRKIELDGRVGSIQKMRTDLLGKMDYNGVDVLDIPVTELEQIEREHVLDWLLSQHDGHSEQFIRGANGHVYGIDKGQCFKFFPDDQLDIKYNPNAMYPHLRTIYNDIGYAIQEGRITNFDTAWTLRAIEQVEAISDEEYLKILKPYAQSRFGRDKGAMDRFLRDAIERKHNLRRDFEAYYQVVFKDPKFKLQAVQTQPKALVQGTRFTEREAKIIEEARAAKARGKSVPIDAQDIEDQNVLIFSESLNDQERTVMTMKIRPEAEQKLLNIIGKAPTTQRHQADMDAQIYEKLLSGVKTINHHIAQGDSAWNIDKINSAKSVHQQILRAINSDDPVQRAMGQYYKKIYDQIFDIVDGRVEPAKISEFLEYKITQKAAEKATSQEFRVTVGALKHTKRQIETNGVLTVIKQEASQQDMFPDLRNIGVQYRVEFDDGTVIRYTPWNDGNLFSQRGQLEITVNGVCSPETVERGLTKLESLAINASVPDPWDQELLYLQKAAYCAGDVKNESYINLINGLDSRQASKGERVQAMRDYWGRKLGVEDVTKLPDYNPTGVWDDEVGWRYHYRFDITDRNLDNEMDGYTLIHSVSSYTEMPDLVDSMLGNTGGLVPTNEKLRFGILPQGMSPDDDMGTGGGAYSFVRIRRVSRGNRMLFFKKSLLRRMDSISYDEDLFGRVTGDTVLKRRAFDIEGFKWHAREGSNETIFKHGISFLSNIEKISAGGPGQKKKVIDVFKKYGITKLPDGRLITDVVVD